jgi:triacylglycerol lipase
MHKYAHLMAKICEFSYIRKKDGSPHAERIHRLLVKIDTRFIKVHSFQAGCAQAIICEHEKYNVLAFRGSDEIQDWIKNFTFFSFNRLGYSLHRGFWQITDMIHDPIKKRLSELPVKPLFVTGHSLGGAMAVVYAVRNLGDVWGLYTFGQPRVFKQGSAQKFTVKTKNRYFRFENNNDAIVHAPPAFFGFKHSGMRMYIDIMRKLRVNINKVEEIIDRISGLFVGIREKGIDLIQDHDIKEYLKGIPNK